MLNWLQRKITGTREPWIRAEQVPGIPFPFPKGAKLRPEENVLLAFPKALIANNEQIGSILLCDDDAEFTLNDEVGACYVKLKPGMTFALAKSCEIMVIAGDTRPRIFQFMRPDKSITEPGAAPNATSAGAPPTSVS
jgi:hypothetical protein